MSVEELARRLSRSPRTVRRWTKDGLPLDAYLEAAAAIQSEPMGVALLEAFGIPTSAQVARRLGATFKTARDGCQRVFEEAGIEV